MQFQKLYLVNPQKVFKPYVYLVVVEICEEIITSFIVIVVKSLQFRACLQIQKQQISLVYLMDYRIN